MGVYSEKAKQLFIGGYNCCQAVVAAFASRFGYDEDQAIKFAEGFGAGMGRMRLTCGAVSGMTAVVGLALSSGREIDVQRRGEIYALVQKMAQEFKDKNGSITCADLLGLTSRTPDSPTPEARTGEYYKKRPCAMCVYDAAEIVEKYLLTP